MESGERALKGIDTRVSYILKVLREAELVSLDWLYSCVTIYSLPPALLPLTMSSLLQLYTGLCPVSCVSFPGVF